MCWSMWGKSHFLTLSCSFWLFFFFFNLKWKRLKSGDKPFIPELSETATTHSVKVELQHLWLFLSAINRLCKVIFFDYLNMWKEKIAKMQRGASENGKRFLSETVFNNNSKSMKVRYERNPSWRRVWNTTVELMCSGSENSETTLRFREIVFSILKSIHHFSST